MALPANPPHQLKDTSLSSNMGAEEAMTLEGGAQIETDMTPIRKSLEMILPGWNYGIMTVSLVFDAVDARD